MKTIRKFGWIMAVLLLAGTAGAQQTVTVQDVMDHDDYVWDLEMGVWFWDPNDIEDHSPWHRTSNEDWGWVHDISTLVPQGATGIQSATLAITAWDVDSEEAEDDVILVNNQYLGMLTGIDRGWKTVTFNLSRSVLDELWLEKALYVFMDIDQMLSLEDGGFRVTVGRSVLTVTFGPTDGLPPDPPTDPTDAVAVHRFWSPVTSGHFYTTDEDERDRLIANYPDFWTYEGPAFQALPEGGSTSARPIHRFWSGTLNGHFYTMSETEKQKLIDTYSYTWNYEGVAFYAFAEGEQPAGTLPVHRFWSPVHSRHFFTMDETEKQKLIDNYPAVWTYEGIAWYAYLP